MFEGIHVAQRHLGEQHDANVIVLRSEAVVGRLARHICKVDPLSKLTETGVSQSVSQSVSHHHQP